MVGEAVGEVQGVVVLVRATLLGETLGVALVGGGHRVVTVDEPLGRPPYAAFLTALRVAAPAAVLVDVEPTDPAGPQLLAALAAAAPAVVAITSSTDAAWWGLCLHQGVHTVIATSEPLSHVLAALARIADGRPTMTPGHRERLLGLGQRAHAEDVERRRRLARLSDRERAMLRHLMAGHHVAEIARIEVVSPATVRAQVRAVLAKLEVTSQLAAVALAHRAGWRGDT